MAKTFFGSKCAQFMDPVHGGIGALQHEVCCIDHPLFQRLRYIFQNDVAHFVFPGATQTRFSHSIGVMHLAGRLYRVLIEQYSAESPESFKYTDDHLDAIYYIYCCFRLAALLHDTGHFPFSHEFERTDFIKDILSDVNVLKDFWGKSELYDKYANRRLSEPDFNATHEDYSLAVAHKILSHAKAQCGLPVEIDDVLCLMEAGSHEFTEKWVKYSGLLFEVFEGCSTTRGQYNETFIAEGVKKFFSLMISGEIDVDKMDYLLRDSYFSGAKYGVYNLDHLLSTLRAGFNPQTKWVGVAVLEKGVVALEDFIYSRFQIYQNMWSHKAVVGNKLLLSDALDSCNKEGFSSELREYLTDANKFAFFTDHYFMEIFRKEAIGGNSLAVKNFLFRRKYKLVARLQNPTEDDIQEKLVALKGVYGDSIKYRKITIKFSKIPDRDYSNIKVITRHNANGKRSLVSLKNTSGFFQKFSEVLIVNFYATEQPIKA